MKDTDKTLEEIIIRRKSVRNFTSEVPDIEKVNKIIKSAMYAPYAGATGIPFSEVRRIFVFEQNSEIIGDVREILQSQLKTNARKLNIISTIFPFLGKKMKPFAKRIKAFSENGIPSLSKAPYLIIIAEKKGFPPIEKQSMAHALQNMWLTATSLDLGFQLISAFGVLSKNEKCLNLLAVPKGQYEFEACVIGCPANNSFKAKEINLDEFVTRMK